MDLKEVLVEELKDLYSAESQLVKALPKIAKGCEDEELAESITQHLEETKGQVERLKQIFEQLGEKPTGKHCKGMEGLLEEGKEVLEEDEDAPFGDLMITGAASRVEHYEIAGYTAVIEIANGLGEQEIVDLLTETLNEELAASEKLSAKAKELIEQAASESEDEAAVSEEDEEGETATSKAKKSTRGRTKAA